MALNVSSPSSDVGVMARYFAAANFSPNGFNFEQWKDDEFEAALKTLAEATDRRTIATRLHRRRTSGWSTIRRGSSSCTISIPRAMSKKVKGFVSPQSWFVDLTLVSCSSGVSAAALAASAARRPSGSSWRRRRP